MFKKILALGMVIGMVNGTEVDSLVSYGDFTTGNLGKIITCAVESKLHSGTVPAGEHGISQVDLARLKPAIEQLGVDSVYQFYMSSFPDYYGYGLTEEQGKAAGKLRTDLFAIMRG